VKQSRVAATCAWRIRSQAIADDDLVLEQQRFNGDGTGATGAEECRSGNEQVNREEKQVARYHACHGAQDCTERANSLMLAIRHRQGCSG